MDAVKNPQTSVDINRSGRFIFVPGLGRTQRRIPPKGVDILEISLSSRSEGFGATASAHFIGIVFATASDPRIQQKDWLCGWVGRQADGCVGVVSLKLVRELQRNLAWLPAYDRRDVRSAAGFKRTHLGRCSFSATLRGFLRMIAEM